MDDLTNRLDAMLLPLRTWLDYAGFGTRGERARLHLDAFVAALTGDERPDEPRARVCGEHGGNLMDALAEAVKDVYWKATQYGLTEDGDTLAYIVPKSAMHRLIGAAQGVGIPAAFRCEEYRIPPVSTEEADRA